jgi:hypothetical protein
LPIAKRSRVQSAYLDHLEFESNKPFVCLSICGICLVVLERGRFWEPCLQDVDEEGNPLLEYLVCETLDHGLVVLQHHFQDVEAASEDTASQCPQDRSSLLIDSHIVYDLDELGCYSEEGDLVEAIVDELAQHLECAVQLSVGGCWYEL